jgi:hypothetical protein
MLVSRGWRFVHLGLLYKHLSSLSIMMGLVYLSYCSMFVTYDVEEAKQMAMVWVTIVHCLIAWDINKHASETEQCISDELAIHEIEFLPGVAGIRDKIKQSLELKLFLMKWFRRITLLKIVFAMGI